MGLGGIPVDLQSKMLRSITPWVILEEEIGTNSYGDRSRNAKDKRLLYVGAT